VHWLLALAVLLIAAAAWYAARRAARKDRNEFALGGLYAAFAASVLALAIGVFPTVDRSQDLVALARRVDSDTAHRDFALLMPDETTLAMFDIAAAGRPVAVLASADEARLRVASNPNLAVFGLLPGKNIGPIHRWLTDHGLATHEKIRATAASRAAEEIGLRIEKVYEVPDGRRYALWSRSMPPPSQQPGSG
jgi:hypothetical protein